jgi:SAM-dependent methyltransferase
MVDDASARDVPPQGARRESHAGRVAVGQTGVVNTIRYGNGIPTEADLRLLGDLSGGKRALELGVSEHQNAIAFAHAGAKALAVDPDARAIEQLRTAATKADEEAQHTTGDPIRVECHVSDLADLGFATSGSISAVVADHTLDSVDDLSRVLRQVHRVLRAGNPFVISVPHPFNAMPYGTAGRTIGDWFTQLARTNFRIDQILELGVSDKSPIPSTLLIRARKEGD